MTTKELHALVEQIGAHLNTLAQLQITTSKLVHEGLERTHEDVQALLAIVQRHHERLNNHGERLDRLDGDEE